MTVKKGDTFQVQGRGWQITPATVTATVVWVDDRDVYYRLEGSLLVEQTSIERFEEIVRRA